MPDPGANSEVIASVAASSALALGQAPASAMGLCYQAMAHSIGLAMENAVAQQQRGQVIAGAAVTQVLALIITKGTSES